VTIRWNNFVTGRTSEFLKIAGMVDRRQGNPLEAREEPMDGIRSRRWPSTSFEREKPRRLLLQTLPSKSEDQKKQSG